MLGRTIRSRNIEMTPLNITRVMQSKINNFNQRDVLKKIRRTTENLLNLISGKVKSIKSKRVTQS